MTTQDIVIAAGKVEGSILLIRGQRVVLDSELAALYGVTTKRLNQQVLRNLERFPDDFMFQLTADEARSLRLQFATSKPERGGRRHLPYAFTEHGVIMAASVLNSEKAVKVSVYVVRAFVKLREMLSTHKELAGKLAELERKLQKHDTQILTLVEAIRQLLEPPPAPRRKRIGYATEHA
jgi:phage regulator Rha-like protein